MSIFNNSAIAKELFPKDKDPVSRFHRKVNNQNGQRLTENDKEKLREIIEKKTKEYLEVIQ